MACRLLTTTLAVGGADRERSEYEQVLAASSPERVPVQRSGDDLYIIYTGGTTGMPKGVVWRQEDAFYSCFGGGDYSRDNPVKTPEEMPERIGRPSGVLPAGAADARRRAVDGVRVVDVGRLQRAHGVTATHRLRRGLASDHRAQGASAHDHRRRGGSAR